MIANKIEPPCHSPYTLFKHSNFFGLFHFEILRFWKISALFSIKIQPLEEITLPKKFCNIFKLCRNRINSPSPLRIFFATEGKNIKAI